METVSRRDFVVAVAAAGGGLLLGCRVDGRRSLAASGESAASAPPAFAPNAFVRIGTDGRITLIMNQVEMGQGMYTSMPMLIAEELEVGLDQVHVEHAPPDDKLYANPIFGFQATGGSTSVRAMYQPLRQAGAAARMMLVAAAAQKWNVEPASCRAQKGVVTHSPTGRTLGYGALADAAAKLPVPDTVTLKDPKDFTLIGTPAKRLDTPDKVNGKAQYGIDVRLPGMKIATVAVSPVVGGKVAGLDERKALAIKGVHQVVRLDDSPARVLLEFVNLKPTESEYKIGVIVAADRMNEQAANAFLKTLEEPPAKSILVLLTTEPQRILETIFSRCLRLSFGGDAQRTLRPEQLAWLTGFSETAAAEQKSLLGRYRLMDVLLKKLNELKTGIEEKLTEQSPLQRYKDAEKDLQERWEDELKAAIEAEYRRQRSELLAVLQWWLRDVWVRKVQSPKSRVQSQTAELLRFPEVTGGERVAGRISAAEAMENLQVMEQLQRWLYTNVQEALALEVGLLKLHL